MAQPHSTQNYVPGGKGILSIAEWSGGAIGAYFDMGNVTSLEVEPTQERLPHYSSRAGFRTKDKDPIIEKSYTVNFVADEICAENMNRFLMGTLSGQNTVYGLQGSDKEYALKFVSDNPAGPNSTWNFWKCSIAPNGPMQLIGEEYQTMSYSASGLADSVNHATSPYFTVVTAEHTSTTTTTT